MKQYHKQNCAWFAGALIAALCSDLFAVILQFFKGRVLDQAVAGQLRAALLSSAALLALILCEVLFYFGYQQLGAKYVVNCTRQLKQDIFESVLWRPYPSFLQHRQGEYISKYTNETDAIRNSHFELLPLLWEILFKITLVSAALFALDWRLAILTLALLTTPLYVPKLIEKALQKAQSDYLKALEQALARVTDWLSGFEIIKNFSIEGPIIRQFGGVNRAAMEKLLRNKQLGATSQLLTTLISYLSYFAVLVCAAWLVLKGVFSAGDFFVAIGMIDQLSYPLISLAGIIRQLVAVKPACKAMEQFLAVPRRAAKETEPPSFREEIRFRDVTFAYPGQPPILQKFNLSIKKGQHCLLQGPSGCGKTTAVNLLLGYYETDSGTITLDGTPISQLGNPYDTMTVVRQEATLFCDTLRNNLTMYRDIPDEVLTAILQKVGLEKFAGDLDIPIAEQGANLSGGEKKRLCLARALLRDTDILLLDEPLANLDEATADKIEDLLLSITGKTVVLVSHQFSEEKLGAFDQILKFNTV